jgi:hypothetical protein
MTSVVEQPNSGAKSGIWTRPIAWTLLVSAGAVAVAILLIPVQENVAFVLMLAGALGLIFVDNVVIHRANRGAPRLEMIANRFELHRRAYKWSAIRAALRGR